MGVLGSDDNTYRVPIIDLREVAFASAPLKAGNTKVVGLIRGCDGLYVGVSWNRS